MVTTHTPPSEEPVAPQPPVQPPIQPAPASVVAVAPTGDNTLPLLSFIFSMVSLIFGAFFGIPAIILGIVGLRKREGKRWMALTGLIVGGSTTLITIIVFIVYVIAAVLGSVYQDNQSNYSPSSDSSGYQSYSNSQT